MKSHRTGFTLIELVLIIVILGILAAVALPRFWDFSGEAKTTSVKGALGALRSAIVNYHAWSATSAGGSTATWPAIGELTSTSTDRLLEQGVPDNPFDTDGTKNNVVVGVTKGTLVGTTGGWAYLAASGEIWANTSVASENTY